MSTLCLYVGLYFGREVSADSEEGKLPLHGPNQWPSPVSSGDTSQRVTATSCHDHQLASVAPRQPAPACLHQRLPVTSLQFNLPV